MLLGNEPPGSQSPRPPLARFGTSPGHNLHTKRFLQAGLREAAIGGEYPMDVTCRLSGVSGIFRPVVPGLSLKILSLKGRQV
ncbi:hypothetical protein VC83_05223 [Pseudogymnoascus destructans]|uniref:Uncharacterized protein n=1 Tax=Pseudogymnoascus destructans TaxID=655981 RepID=A0A177A9E8_9PEZI|nr:uncharacterized protein VC83_05223 [Pseudogymnoascus destructans]OAF57901.1 hypothetical protein VC83_05223 [Pseudogymnoascus destructans]